ncbi:hypothetical protein [Xenorhabdus innexi]|uniref:Uncharacterized protein n=1 Tax=Xenorhabdus innexi TaxID=290109 RepID=A0A1N6MWH6_9GAMM|nr:hypothetical protein [Xenorhabdus innexi]PHM27815.1 hypothetical protein Xinn_03934 [Xenorhabdus innexi]SIP73162.1 conserved exported hypothetical protein [Xenorhabdus innexi]
MKKLLMVCVMFALMGCGDNYSEYNGVYTCKVGRLINYMAIEKGSEYSFPPGTGKARMTFNNGVMIINGVNAGDYVGHQMVLATPSGRVFKYDDGEFSEEFSPRDGRVKITIGNPSNETVMHLLTHCKKEQE